MDIRPLRRDELERFVDELWLPLAREMAELNERNALAPDARAVARSGHRDWIDDDDRRTLLAVDGDALVGFVAGKVAPAPPVFDRGPDLHVTDLYVRPEHRRRGLGARLMDAIVDWGRAQGCESTSLSVEAGNDPAVRLYRDLGYEVARYRMTKPA